MSKRYLLQFLSPLGGFISAACFFLPWVKVSSIYQLSGLEKGGVLWMIFFMAIAIIAAFFARRQWLVIARSIIIIASFGSIVLMLFVYYYVWTAEILFIDVKSIFEIKLQPSGFGMVAGFVLALAGSIFVSEET